ncbi:MAG: N-formylglutamate deformylase, partial [Gammaproteobacteria bacterium]|nr:N-formylglutamate deformylase [Gammaproteobacteria bacterium]
MTAEYSFHAGNTPLLVSVPHDGRELPADLAAQMNDLGRSLPDTDWHVARLYEFAADLGASLLVANYSRYVVDLNRPADDAALYATRPATGLCPTQTFAGQDIYAQATAIDVDDRVSRYWRPYHDKVAATLAKLRESFGYALLWDAHSIASRVPALFDGELPELNVGTWDGRSCSRVITDAVLQVVQASTYSGVLNGRFKGGYITRHYGQPGASVHAVQLEIAQRAYMDEQSTNYDEAKASQLRDVL